MRSFGVPFAILGSCMLHLADAPECVGGGDVVNHSRVLRLRRLGGANELAAILHAARARNTTSKESRHSSGRGEKLSHAIRALASLWGALGASASCVGALRTDGVARDPDRRIGAHLENESKAYVSRCGPRRWHNTQHHASSGHVAMPRVRRVALASLCWSGDRIVHGEAKLSEAKRS